MQRPNQPASTECCSAGGQEGSSMVGGSLRTTAEKRTQGTARAATGSRTPVKQFSLDTVFMQVGRGFGPLHPTPKEPSKVRFRRACRGLRAWRAKRESAETWETPPFPGVLTARTHRVGRGNDKKRDLRVAWESDRLIVVRSNPVQAGPIRAKEPTQTRSPQRKPWPQEWRVTLANLPAGGESVCL